MSSFELPAKLIRLVRMTITNVTCQLRVDGKLSGPFTTTKGLRQGVGLACLLFNLDAREGHPRLEGSDYGNHLLYVNPDPGIS